MSCFEIRESLSAWIDGELPAEREALAENHLAGCEDCRLVLEELTEARRSLVGRFDVLRAGAPAVPTALREPPRAFARRHTRWRHPSTWLVAAAVVLISIAALIYDPAEPAMAGGTPEELIGRASANYARFRDAELRVRLGFPAIDALRSAFGDEKVESEPAAASFSVFMESPDHILIRDLGEKAGVFGYDGADRWQYEPESGEVVVGGDDMKIHFGGKDETGDEKAQDVDWMDILSWRFVRDLDGRADDFDIREDTWPADRRSGRRVFRITPKTPDSKIVWGSMTLVIDPQRDLIERAEVEISLVGFSLVRVRADLVETDTGYPAGFFHWSRHVPEGTRVRREEGK